MDNKILLSTGAISLVLFEKEEKDFLNSIPDVIKRNLFPDLSDLEVEKELVKLHKKYGSNKQNTNSSIGTKRKTNRNNK